MIETTCNVCGKAYLTYPRQLRRVKRPTCSRECNGVNRGREWATHGSKGRAGWTAKSAAAYREKMTGARNPAWKGGVTIFKTHGAYTGVKYVRAPEWARPMARADGYVMEHRLAMARMCGRLLLRNEVVHHLNHDPTDNTPSNLEMWPSNGSHKAAEHGRVAEGVANRWRPRSFRAL